MKPFIAFAREKCGLHIMVGEEDFRDIEWQKKANIKLTMGKF